MTNDEIVLRLRNILSQQIDWYREQKKLEAAGEISSSYIYDTAYEVFDELRTAYYVDILDLLA